MKSRELALKVVDAIGPERFLKRPDEENSGNGSLCGKNPDWKREIQDRVGEVMGGLGDLLESIGLSTPLDSREKAVINLMKNLEIETQKNTNTLSLSYEGKSPKFAETVLSRLIDFYLDKHITAYRTPGSYGFFDQQAEDLRNQLAKTEEELKTLKNKTGVASLDDQRKILLDRIGTLQQETEATQAALAISRAKVKDLKEKAGRFLSHFGDPGNEEQFHSRSGAHALQAL